MLIYGNKTADGLYFLRPYHFGGGGFFLAFDKIQEIYHGTSETNCFSAI